MLNVVALLPPLCSVCNLQTNRQNSSSRYGPCVSQLLDWIQFEVLCAMYKKVLERTPRVCALVPFACGG